MNKNINRFFIAFVLVIILIVSVSCNLVRKEVKPTEFVEQKYTIDERQGVPLTAITTNEDAEQELTPEEKAALWQKKQEEEDKYRQWKDSRDNERQEREEEERIDDEIKFFNNSR